MNDAPEDAKRVLDEFRGTLLDLHRQGKIHWQHLDLSGPARRRFLDGGSVRPDTIRRILRMVNLPVAEGNRVIHAAEEIHRHEVAGGWQRRKALGVRRSYRWFSAWRHRHYTEAGRWLLQQLKMLFESSAAFQRETGIDAHSTLRPYFFSRRFHPSRDVLERLASSLNHRRVTRGEPALDLDRDFPQFGCGITVEEWRSRATASTQVLARNEQCKFCRRYRRDHPAGTRDCAMLARTLARGLPRAGGKVLWTLMAATAEIPPRTIAKHMGQAESTVREWLDDPRRQATIAAIRSRRSAGGGLADAMAKVLGISRTTLGEYLHDRACRPAGMRSPRFSKRGTIDRLAAAMGMTSSKCRAAFERKDLEAGHIKTIQRRRWTPVRHGRPISDCQLVRLIVQQHARGKSNVEIVMQISARSLDGDAPTEKAVSWTIPVQHGRRCPRCRPFVAFDMRARGMTVRAVADVLRVSIGTVSNDIASARPQMPRFGYGLLMVHEVARLAGLSPDAIRWHVKHGHLAAARTALAWRQFRREDVDRFLKQRTEKNTPTEH